MTNAPTPTPQHPFPPRGFPAQGFPAQGPSDPYAATPAGPQAAWPQVAPPQPRKSRLPSTAEVLGWGGGLTTVVGVVAVTWDLWSQVTGLALVGLLAAATLVLGVAAAVVGDLDRGHDDQLAANLSAGLWWMTGIAGAVCTYVATDVLSDGRTHLALLAASVAATAMFAAAAHRTRRDGMLAGAVSSAAVAAFAAASLASMPDPGRALAVWLVGVGAVIGLAAIVRPATRMTFAASLVVLYGGAQSVLSGYPQPDSAVVVLVLLGSVIAAAMTIWRRSTAEGVSAALVTGVIGAQVLYELAPQVFSLPTTVLLAGIAMTGACIHLVRRSARP